MRIMVVLLLLLVHAGNVQAEDGWVDLFNGKDLTGWRANRSPESFTVVDGAIKAHAVKEPSHLFYVGDEKEGSFVRYKNFELKATVKGEPSSNSGIYFHTDFTLSKGPGWLDKGYEVQLNSTEKEKRKTGSLYAVVDLDKSPVDETQWFDVHIKVNGNHITVKINDKQVVDYTQEADVKRTGERAGRLLMAEGGAIALQGHDPKSTFYFKDIKIKKLP